MRRESRDSGFLRLLSVSRKEGKRPHSFDGIRIQAKLVLGESLAQGLVKDCAEMVMLRMPDPFAITRLDTEKEFKPAQGRAKRTELGALPVDDAGDGARALIHVDIWLLQVGVVEHLGVLGPKDDGQPLAHLRQLRMEARRKGALERVEPLGRVVDLGAGLANFMVLCTRQRGCNESGALFQLVLGKRKGGSTNMAKSLTERVSRSSHLSW